MFNHIRITSLLGQVNIKKTKRNWRTVLTRWAKIEGFENYSISDRGQVYSRFSKKILKPNPRNGYRSVLLQYKGLQKRLNIHRLVAIHFIVKRDNKHQVNHIDGNKNNNKYSNLEWCTAKENVKHAHDTGLIDNKLENNRSSKLSCKDVLEIRYLIKCKLFTYRQIGLFYSVDRNTIYHINIKRTWRTL